MNQTEREVTLRRMDETITRFYGSAVQIGTHPFIEFAGVMTAYLRSCERAHEAGIDFTECNAHTGQQLPVESFEVTYLNEKLNCIFGGRFAATPAAPSQAPADVARLVQALSDSLGAIAAMQEQIGQMRGMFDDADETIQEAVDAGDDALAEGRAALRPFQGAGAAPAAVELATADGVEDGARGNSRQRNG